MLMKSKFTSYVQILNQNLRQKKGRYLHYIVQENVDIKPVMRQEYQDSVLQDIEAAGCQQHCHKQPRKKPDGLEHNQDNKTVVGGYCLVEVGDCCLVEGAGQSTLAEKATVVGESMLEEKAGVGGSMLEEKAGVGQSTLEESQSMFEEEKVVVNKVIMVNQF